MKDNMVKDDKTGRLNKLKQRMKNDINLPLREKATNLVFGEGDSETKVLFIGEAPGFWEDKKGRPFVGNAGALLNQLLISIGLERNKVFITNVIHFRPPENRDPELYEIEAFKPYLDEIINIINPRIIVTLGRFSMSKFIPNTRITAVHGKKHVVNWRGRDYIIVPMYHPAAGLRSVEIKQSLISDFKKLSEIISVLNETEKDRIEQMKLV